MRSPSSLFALELFYLVLLTSGGGSNGQGQGQNQGQGQGQGVWDRGSDDLRLLVNDIRLIGLGGRMEALREKLETARQTKTEGKIYRDIAVRVSELEGTGCAENQLQCGGAGIECVSDLLVCDRVKDCHNGHDEDPEFCDVSGIRAGTTFSGWYASNSCLLGAGKTYICHKTILEVKRSRVFPSHLLLTIDVTCDWKDEPPLLGKVRHVLFASYQIANRRFDHYDLGYGTECYFPYDNFDEIHCSVKYGEATCIPHLIALRRK